MRELEAQIELVDYVISVESYWQFGAIYINVFVGDGFNRSYSQKVLSLAKRYMHADFRADIGHLTANTIVQIRRNSDGVRLFEFVGSIHRPEDGGIQQGQTVYGQYYWHERERPF